MCQKAKSMLFFIFILLVDNNTVVAYFLVVGRNKNIPSFAQRVILTASAFRKNATYRVYVQFIISTS
jgi:hypothetical protein